MDKFKYEIYDYSKIGFKKKNALFRKILTEVEWKSIKSMGRTPEDSVLVLYRELKNTFFSEHPNYKYDPNIDWYWEIETPDKTYSFK